MASLNELLYDIRRRAEHRERLTDKKIKKIYRSLMDDLSAFVGKQYVKYADEEGRLFVSYLDSKNARAKFLQEIVDNVDNITPEVQAEIVRLVNETYEKSYKGMSEALQKADTAEKFEAITKDIATNPNVLRQAVNNNISKLTLPAVLEKHRNEIIYQIQQELNIGLMRGDRYEKMAKRIAERVGVSYSKARNIVRTETHRNVESGFMDCAEHIQEGMDGSEFIYAATWRTMKDERVRPQRRVKTKKGWKTTYSKNGANHMKMEGVTVKVGELFDLGNGVKAKAPSQSGVAAHDCQCRCFLEYNLMTVEEFAKATKHTVEYVRSKYIGGHDSGENDVNDKAVLSTYVNSSENLYRYAKKIKPIDGYEDIVIHGNKTGLTIKDMDGNDATSYTPRVFAEILREDPNYHGGAIRLISCETGAKDAIVAQSLANLLGVNVLAPSDVVVVLSDGSIEVGYDGKGEWKLFKPR